MIRSFKKCFAVGCDSCIPRSMLMCRAHWRLVPGHLQADVYATWRCWQAGGSGRRYILATLRAQFAIAEIENHSDVSKTIAAEIAEIEGKEALREA